MRLFIRIILQLIGLFITFIIPIIQSSLSNLIVLDKPKTYTALIKVPLFWICLAIYIIGTALLQININKKKISKKNAKKLEDAEVDRKVRELERKPIDEKNEEEILRWASTEMKAAIMAQTAQRARENDLDAVRDYVEILNMIDESAGKEEGIDGQSTKNNKKSNSKKKRKRRNRKRRS